MIRAGYSVNYTLVRSTGLAGNFSLIGLLTLCFGARVIAAGMGVVRSLGGRRRGIHASVDGAPKG
jgi:hypothetical protein